MRVASKIIAIRLRGMLHWPPNDPPRRTRFSRTSSSSASASPVGENPFDTDYNGHMTSSTYERNLDYARMRAACICFPSVLEARGWLGLGQSRFVFVKVSSISRSRSLFIFGPAVVCMASPFVGYLY